MGLGMGIVIRIVDVSGYRGDLIWIYRYGVKVDSVGAFALVTARRLRFGGGGR
jgi:hypothetical protein